MAPMPTAAVAVPMSTSAPDLIRTAALAPSVNLTAHEATAWSGPAVKLKLGQPTPPAPQTLSVPPTSSAPPTPLVSSGLERLSTVAMVALTRMAIPEETVGLK